MMRILAGLVLAFALAAAPASLAQPASPIVVIGDLHGDYAKFHAMLRQAGLIGETGAWTGGRARLVQLGDVPDRGAETRKILDLLIALEPQARRAGGRVHALIGNHEAMNMAGDLRYVSAGEYAAFADAGSAGRRDAYYQRVVAALTAKPPAAGVPVFDAAYRAKFDAEHPLGWVEHRLAWGADGVYGRYVLGHQAVLKLDDMLFLHGGLGRSYLPYDPEVMNRAVVAALKGQPEGRGAPPAILENPEGPLWYRGLAQNPEGAEAAHVAALLSRHGVKRIVIGHTKAFSMVNSRFDGAVVLTDIAVAGGCKDPQAFLVVEGGTLTAVHRGTRLPLGVTGEAKAAYLAQVAQLDQGQCVARPAGTPAAPIDNDG